MYSFFFLLHSLCISDITVHPPEQISLSKICVCALRIFKTHKNDGNRFPSDFIRRDLPRKGDLVKVACFSYFSKTLRHQKPYCGFWWKKPKTNKQAGIPYVAVKLRQSNWYSWVLSDVWDVWLTHRKPVNQLCQFRAEADESLGWFRNTLFEPNRHNTFISIAYIFCKAIMEGLSMAYVTTCELNTFYEAHIHKSL